MDIEHARHNMIEQQIRPWDVLDQSVLDLLLKLRREDFVPPAHRALAFVDMEIPLGHGQSMWPPRLEARVLQELAIQPGERVLEVGTGSGYFAALLAAQAAEVASVEIIPELAEAARRTLRAHGVANVATHVGDAARDWFDPAGFDVIVLTGSTPLLPDTWCERLREGGRLFAIVGEAPVMQARLVTRGAAGVARGTTLFETCVTPLINAPQPAAFVF
jgi:protein-L-isoaspartate(D-aspartate) O-methyltransferase